MADPLPLDAFDLAPGDIAARITWARRRGHPFYLWPDVSIAAWRRALAEVERVTRAVLAPAGAAAVPALSDRVGERALQVAAYTSGMGPLLGYWSESGLLAASDPAADLLRLHLTHGRARAGRARAVARAALDRIAGAGLDALVIKGTHTGRTYFPDPGTRPTSDIDLVCLDDALSEAETALRAAGYEPGHRFETPPRRDWFPPGASRHLRSLLVVQADDPMPVDLQGSLERRFHGTRPVDVTGGAPATAPWPGFHPNARTLTQPHLTAFLAVHVSDELQHVQLIRLVELAMVIRHDLASGALSWSDLGALLERRGLTRYAHPSLELAERLVPGTLDPGFRARLASSATRLAARVMADLTPASAQGIGSQSLSRRFMWAASPREAARCALALLLPSRTNAKPARQVLAERFYRVIRGRVSVGPGNQDERAPADEPADTSR